MDKKDFRGQTGLQTPSRLGFYIPPGQYQSAIRLKIFTYDYALHFFCDALSFDRLKHNIQLYLPFRIKHRIYWLVKDMKKQHPFEAKSAL